MERYICIHGHFYQPPRENPSLEAVEVQDSAYPHHDWNERITAECYGPNGASRILDGEGRIVTIFNNYAKMSFNFGPTLLAWMEEKAPEVYASILAADRESRENFSGHGSALAQAYSHMIMPLANQNDKHTQVHWGIGDFVHRFGRQPEGMWLPETAVDLAALDMLAEHGIRFTILAQHQAGRVRRLGDRNWRNTSSGQIDPTMAYEIHLPSGRTMSLFFYDGPISRAVAFDDLLGKGENFANRLMSAFADWRQWPQMVHIATDGETYGHHHRFADMALAYALHYIESNNLARLTNYGEYVEKRPPTHEVEIIENTSWSCSHGIERWKSNCGCSSGGNPGWSQAWRAPLRHAFDWLRDSLASRFEQEGRQLLKDPWVARNDYISVVLDRSRGNVERFLQDHATHDLDEAERVRALKLLEMQRHAMLMYTSCGWFFDEISGIETVQTIQYAARALQLAEEVQGGSLEPRFLELLGQAKSNVPEHEDGRRIFEKLVKPGLVDIQQVGAHYAINSLFENYGDVARVYCYTVDREDHRLLSNGRVKIALGRAKITSEITGESKRVNFGVMHLGDHNLSGGIKEFDDDDSYEAMVQAIGDVALRPDLAEIIRAIDGSFGSSYSLRQLFRDEQRRILEKILNSTLSDAESLYRHVYEDHAPMMRFLAELSTPLPQAWRAAAELVINTSLRRAMKQEDLDLEGIASLLAEARRWQVALDGAGLGYALGQTLERLTERLRASPDDLSHIEKLAAVIDMIGALPFEVNLWKVQNTFYDLLLKVLAATPDGGPSGSEVSRPLLDRLTLLGEKLKVRVSNMKEHQTRQDAAVANSADTISAQRNAPGATYRLQFNRNFTFRDAQALIPYLHDLGITECYASPLLKARCDSTHGYDICDHSQLNPVIGSEEDFDAFSSDLRQHGMGLILDTVPNHMAIGDANNVWWMDVLENGPSSIYAQYFDIDWRPVKPELRNKVLLPILEDQYGKVLESGKLRLSYEDGDFFIHYYNTKLPVNPRTYTRILRHELGTLLQALGENDEHVRELQSILTALGHLPPRSELSPERIAERTREREVIRGRIAALYRSNTYVRAAVEMAVNVFNGVVGDPRSFDLLDDLLYAQAYRPAYWRVASEEINYRRFFDVNEMAAIRVELPEVFQAAHQLTLRLLSEGKVTGLRIDHPDGLRDPRTYFRQLQESYVFHRVREHFGSRRSEDVLKATVSTWLSDRLAQVQLGTNPCPLYVVAEKILSKGESLPDDWAVEGTTGYDFLNAVNGIFVDSSSRKAFDKLHSAFVGREIDFHELTHSTKKMILLVSMSSELNELCHQLERIAEKNRLYRDFTLNSLIFAIREVIAYLPVYRTYVTGPGMVGRQDHGYIEAAVAEAKKRNPRTAAAIFDFIRDSLLLRNIQDFRENDQQALIDLVMEFQQLTGPVMAKGLEDTAFYIFNRLASLNEVGGSPDQFGIPVSKLHQQNAERRQRWPRSMLSTSTHDTKRSEDVRARINVLSEMPEEWRGALARWSRLNATKKQVIKNEEAPYRDDEYLLYQTLLGTWPEGTLGPEDLVRYRERIAAYMFKATKEAKLHTSWINPNEEYDAAVQEFVRRILPDEGEDPFIEDLMTLKERVAYYGRFNSLSQVLLKLTSPGVPDIYQGNELWDFSLVDPDNRRPVDFNLRQALLAGLRQQVEGHNPGLEELAQELLETSPDGRIKLYLTYRALNFRRSEQELFIKGSYLPLQARGEKRHHLCAHSRQLGRKAAITVVPRLVVRLTGGLERPPLGTEVWGDTWLALPRERVGQVYTNIFTGEELTVAEGNGVNGLPLAAILARFPVALLQRMAARQ